MSPSRSTPSLVPNADLTAHLVLDDFGKDGRIYRETAEAEANLETVIRDILDGQYNNPACVVAFNVAEGWAREVTGDVAREVLKRAMSENKSLPGTVRDFIERETGEEIKLPA